MSKVCLGDRVRDRISGIEGIAIARTEWLFGCVRISVQPFGEKDGRPPDNFVVDEPQCVVISINDLNLVTPKPTHGGRDDVIRSADPTH